ncbi:MAG TPA: carboxymuconolactone decarboxylase family protein [Pyrinomonadaceae bacterium]|nr:carboxymuconolactone decarboxylase family protein [Pyrinomonadaceae bacterium]
MRLEPIENPKGIFLKIAYWFTKRQFGKVMSPLKVIYARKPELLSFAMKIAKFEEKQNSLSPDLRLLIKVATATQNGCTFCQDIALAHAVKGKIGTEKFVALITKDEAKMSVFSEKEQIVLAVLEEYNTERNVSDETFAELRKYFNETEIIEILALNAFEHFYNAMTIPLRIESDGLQKLAEKN